MSLACELRVTRQGFTLDAALEARPGETVVLVGPNGAGKSTLVDALAGLVPLDLGRVELDGAVLEDTATGVRLPARARAIGVMFQGLALFPHLSVRDNAAFGLVARGARWRDARSAVAPLLERLELTALATRRPRELSGGEAQRIALARALAIRPKLLLLDEPLSALDVELRAKTRAQLAGLLREFSGVRLVITHDPLEALLVADRLVVLEQGRVVQTGPPDALRRAPRSGYVAALVGRNLVRGELHAAGGDQVLVAGEIALVVAPRGIPPGAKVFAAIEPRAVSLSAERPHSSARNVLEGRVEALDRDGDRVRVRIASAPPLVAEITVASAHALGLVPGARVFAAIKATEIDVYER